MVAERHRSVLGDLRECNGEAVGEMPGDSDGLAEGSADGLMIGLANDNVVGELR